MQNCNCSRDQPLLMKKSVKGPSGFVYSNGYYSEQKSFFFSPGSQKPRPILFPDFRRKDQFLETFHIFCVLNGRPTSLPILLYFYASYCNVFLLSKRPVFSDLFTFFARTAAYFIPVI